MFTDQVAVGTSHAMRFYAAPYDQARVGGVHVATEEYTTLALTQAFYFAGSAATTGPYGSIVSGRPPSYGGPCFATRASPSIPAKFRQIQARATTCDDPSAPKLLTFNSCGLATSVFRFATGLSWYAVFKANIRRAACPINVVRHDDHACTLAGNASHLASCIDLGCLPDDRLAAFAPIADALLAIFRNPTIMRRECQLRKAHDHKFGRHLAPGGAC